MQTKQLNQLELNKLQKSYVKIYGERWREYFCKHYWCVYDGLTGQCSYVKCTWCPRKKQ